VAQWTTPINVKLLQLLSSYRNTTVAARIELSEFILSLIGWDRLVTNLQVPSGFGITPMRDICKVKIGILVNGPKIIPLETSLFSFARVSA
jgi:hypothetical protein